MMNKLLLLIAFLFALVYSQCDSTNCADCTKNDECGWCGASQKCIKGDAKGPNQADGYCLGGTWQYQTCVDCAQHGTDCVSCVEYPGCCFASGKCVDLLFGCSTTCSCDSYNDCGSCLSPAAKAAGCKWCGVEEKCLSSTESCSGPIEHTCDCTKIGSCQACRDTTGCRWCNEDENTKFQCVNEGSSCPTALTCQQYCDQAKSCNDCQYMFGCGWCKDSEKCLDSAYPGSCSMFLHTCPIDCTEYKTCDACILFSQCTWCSNMNGGKGACADPNLEENCKLRAHSCSSNNLSGGSFDGGAFVGGMFLMAGLGVLGAGGFIFYRRRQAQAAYTQVN